MNRYRKNESFQILRSIVVCFVLALTGMLLHNTDVSAKRTEQDGIYYVQINEQSVYVAGTKKDFECEGTLQIPDVIKGGKKLCRVVAVTRGAFYNQSMEEVVLGNNIRKIDSYAFANCSALRRVSLGNDLKRIEENAFVGSNQISEIVIRTCEDDRDNTIKSKSEGSQKKRSIRIAKEGNPYLVDLFTNENKFELGDTFAVKMDEKVERITIKGFGTVDWEICQRENVGQVKLESTHEHTASGVWEMVREANETVDGLEVMRCLSCGKVVKQKQIPQTVVSREVLRGKSILGFGDSLLCAHDLGKEYSWLNLLGEKDGVTIYNRGISGNTLAVSASCASKAMVLRVREASGSGITSPAIVLIEGGGNDYRMNVPMGTTLPITTNAVVLPDGSITRISNHEKEELQLKQQECERQNKPYFGAALLEISKDNPVYDESTFCGALMSMISQIRKMYPEAKIICMTTFRRKDVVRNSCGYTEQQYAQVMMNICNREGIICCDNFGLTKDAEPVFDFLDGEELLWGDEGYVSEKRLNQHFSAEAYRYILPLYESFLLQSLA